MELDYETLVEKQFLKAKVKPLFPGKLRTPSGKIELYSQRMKANGHPPLPTYIPIVNDGDGIIRISLFQDQIIIF